MLTENIDYGLNNIESKDCKVVRRDLSSRCFNHYLKDLIVNNGNKLPSPVENDVLKIE